MFSIGEFSKITGLTVKTLRFYHDEGVLVPRFVDPETGYRYYDPSQADTARAIACLRGLEFSLADIREILREQQDDEQFFELIERHKGVLKERIKHFQTALKRLERFLGEEKQARASSLTAYEIEVKDLAPLLVAGIRMKGRYSDCGGGFRQIGRNLGRYISGNPFLLHYDDEFRESDADFEACMPVRVRKQVEGVAVRELPGGRCVALRHRGRYEHLGHAYARVFKYVREHRYTVVMPTREIYLRGPGMILRGNAHKYLTEIQIPIETSR